MKPKRNPLDLRHQRFNGCDQIKAIVKNTRSRSACFWIEVANISGSGVGIVYHGSSHVPFAVNDELHLTLDTACVVYRRPIHIKVNVRWREDLEAPAREIGAQRIVLGCKIVFVEPIHMMVWNDGLQKLAKLETVSEPWVQNQLQFVRA